MRTFTFKVVEHVLDFFCCRPVAILQQLGKLLVDLILISQCIAFCLNLVYCMTDLVCPRTTASYS